MSLADALVVGAGPAGSVAALLLARAGLRVRLIDRARFPRFKLCGDTLNPGALAILHDIDESAWRRVLARSLPIDGMTVTGPGGACVTADYPAGVRGVAMARSDLDLLLLEAAIAAGAQFEDGINVVGPVLDEGPQVGSAKAGHHVRRTSYVVSGFSRTARVTGVRIAAAGGERCLSARIVIAADGRGSRLGGALGLSRFAARPRRWAFGAHYRGVAGLTAHGEMHIRGDGYLGIAPLPGGAANVCVVRERSSLCAAVSHGRAAAGEGPLDARTIIDEAVAADPSLRERFAAAARCTAVTALGPLALEAGAAGVPGLLLAGDAAGFVDPMTGDGLRFAIRGGALAAQAALQELADGEAAFPSLQEARRREFASKWRVNRALRALVGSPRAVALAAALTGHWDAPVRYLIAIAGDVALATHGGPGLAESLPVRAEPERRRERAKA